MKKIILILLPIMALFSCSEGNIKSVGATELNNAWFWTMTITDEVTKEDVYEYVKKNANPKRTSWFFFYHTGDAPQNYSEIKNSEPIYGLYKTPMDETIYDDALWLMQQK